VSRLHRRARRDALSALSEEGIGDSEMLLAT
jgi:hypothetical protein